MEPHSNLVSFYAKSFNKVLIGIFENFTFNTARYSYSRDKVIETALIFQEVPGSKVLY